MNKNTAKGWKEAAGTIQQTHRVKLYKRYVRMHTLHLHFSTTAKTQKTMVTTIPKKRALILALCLFPSCLVWTPYAFECGGGYYRSIGGRHHRHREPVVPPLPLSLQLQQQQQQQRPNAKLELSMNNVIQQDCQQQQQQHFHTSNDDSTIIIRNGITAGAGDKNNDAAMHSSLEIQSELPTIKRNQNKKRIRWTAVAALLLIGQVLMGKVGPNNNWITTNAAAVASSTATTTTTTSTTTTGGPIMFSAVSASILRRRQTGIATIPVNLLQVVSLAFMLWQLLTQAGTLIRIAGLYCSQFMKWYTSILSSSPLLTKTITGATIGVVGDMIAQYLERRIETKQSKNHNDHQQRQQSQDTTDLLTMYEQQRKFSTTDLSDSFNENITTTNRNGYLKKIWQRIRRYDGRRGASVVGENLLISGPLLHIAYDTLEHLIPTTGGGIFASVAAAGHVLADNFLLDPIFVAITFIMTGLAEGYSIRDLKSQFRSDFPATIRTTWAASIFLAPVGFVCFRFFPLNYRVLGVNFIDIAWDALISFSIHRSRRGHHNQQKNHEYEVQNHAVVPASI